jgi:hypothetical protein
VIEMLFDDDELVPPAEVAACAARGLDLRRRFRRGGTEVGRARAEQLVARRAVSARDIKAIYSYFARHAVDRRAAQWADESNPSAGYVAWLLWGGDPGRDWIGRLREKLRGLDG